MLNELHCAVAQSLLALATQESPLLANVGGHKVLHTAAVVLAGPVKKHRVSKMLLIVIQGGKMELTNRM